MLGRADSIQKIFVSFQPSQTSALGTDFKPIYCGGRWQQLRNSQSGIIHPTGMMSDVWTSLSMIWPWPKLLLFIHSGQCKITCFIKQNSEIWKLYLTVLKECSSIPIPAKDEDKESGLQETELVDVDMPTWISTEHGGSIRRSCRIIGFPNPLIWIHSLWVPKTSMNLQTLFSGCRSGSQRGLSHPLSYHGTTNTAVVLYRCQELWDI